MHSPQPELYLRTEGVMVWSIECPCEENITDLLHSNRNYADASLRTQTLQMHHVPTLFLLQVIWPSNVAVERNSQFLRFREVHSNCADVLPYVHVWPQFLPHPSPWASPWLGSQNIYVKGRGTLKKWARGAVGYQERHFMDPLQVLCVSMVQSSWLMGAAEVGSGSERMQGRPDGAMSLRAAWVLRMSMIVLFSRECARQRLETVSISADSRITVNMSTGRFIQWEAMVLETEDLWSPSVDGGWRSQWLVLTVNWRWWCGLSNLARGWTYGLR